MAKKAGLQIRTSKGPNARPVTQYQHPVNKDWNTSAGWAAVLGLSGPNSFQSRLRRYREGTISETQLFEMCLTASPEVMKRANALRDSAALNMNTAQVVQATEEVSTVDANEVIDQLGDLESYLKMNSKQFEQELEAVGRAYQEAKRKLEMLTKSPQFAVRTSEYLTSKVREATKKITNPLVKQALVGYKPIIVWVSSDNKPHSLVELYENYLKESAPTDKNTASAGPVVTVVPVAKLTEDSLYEGDYDEDDEDEDEDDL